MSSCHKNLFTKNSEDSFGRNCSHAFEDSDVTATQYLRLQAGSVSVTVFWNRAPCSQVEVDLRLTDMFSLHY
jgi:hypothetical protein